LKPAAQKAALFTPGLVKIETAKTSFDTALDAVRVSTLQICKRLHDV